MVITVNDRHIPERKKLLTEHKNQLWRRAILPKNSVKTRGVGLRFSTIYLYIGSKEGDDWSVRTATNTSRAFEQHSSSFLIIINMLTLSICLMAFLRIYIECVGCSFEWDAVFARNTHTHSSFEDSNTSSHEYKNQHNNTSPFAQNFYCYFGTFIIPTYVWCCCAINTLFYSQ